MTDPVAVASAAERAYAEVKGRILDRTIEGGTLLSEGEIALELGVSRTPVREAGGNSILSEVYQTLQDRQRRMATRSVWLQSGRRQRIVDQHIELAALISGHNLRSFAHELDVHMRDIHQDLLA